MDGCWPLALRVSAAVSVMLLRSLRRADRCSAQRMRGPRAAGCLLPSIHPHAPASGTQAHPPVLRCALLQWQEAPPILLAVAPVKMIDTGLPAGSLKDAAVTTVPTAIGLFLRVAICVQARGGREGALCLRHASAPSAARGPAQPLPMRPAWASCCTCAGHVVGVPCCARARRGAGEFQKDA